MRKIWSTLEFEALVKELADISGQPEESVHHALKLNYNITKLPLKTILAYLLANAYMNFKQASNQDLDELFSKIGLSTTEKLFIESSIYKNYPVAMGDAVQLLMLEEEEVKAPREIESVFSDLLDMGDVLFQAGTKRAGDTYTQTIRFQDKKPTSAELTKAVNSIMKVHGLIAKQVSVIPQDDNWVQIRITL